MSMRGIWRCEFGEEGRERTRCEMKGEKKGGGGGGFLVVIDVGAILEMCDAEEMKDEG